MNDKFIIRVNVGGVPCRLTIDRKEEQIYRDAVLRINGKISQYREKHANADLVNLLAITALHHTVEMIEAVQQNDTEPMIEALEKMNQMLDGCVKE